MATRVFELARELGVTSKVMLEKCRAEGLEIKNHMSTLSAGLEATVREWFSDQPGAGTAIEDTEHIDLKAARNEASKRKRRKKKEAEEAKAAAEAETVAQGPAEQEAVAEQAAEEVVEVEEAPAAEELEAETVAEVEVEAPEAQPPAKRVKKKAKPEKKEPPKPEEIKPMGPQVVPKPATLRGPKVIRVEKPDYVPAPRPRRAPGPLGPKAQPSEPIERAAPKRGKAPAPDTGEGGAKSRKAKKRSPRRRSSRVADSGERLKEWRDQDLLERSERLAAASGGFRRHRASVSHRQAASGAGTKTGKIEIDEPISVKSLSAITGIKVADIIKKLMVAGVLATANNVLDTEMAETVMLEYGIELVVKQAKTAEDELLEKLEARERGELSPRAPVVTFLGHVDHGKTSLLDSIRNTAVTEGEAGGITQHIGAYRFDKDDMHVVFLDTPGHEAFTAMRARGANMTDVVVLVVAADDGIMPQTVEAISHAKAAGVPIVVALNKVDLPNANVQRALGQLAEHELHPREWGGETEVIETSAETGLGIETLVETLSLEAELLELKAETDAPASGYVIESEMDPGFGVVTTLLVRNGTLKVGDIVLAGRGFGRIRSMRDDRNRSIKQAPAATPVEVAGLDELPESGDKFYVVKDLDQARTAAEDRRAAARSRQLATGPKLGLEEMLSQIEAGEIHELALIIKADVQGSLEAIVGSFNKLGSEETKVKILHTAVGGISTGDVALAEASNAIIIGFNVIAGSAARQLAESKGVDIHLYRVIYEAIEDVQTMLEKGLAPEIHQEVLGHAEVRQVFKASRIGTIAGCYVTDGLVQRGAKCRIIRNDVVIEDERTLDSLKRFKDDAREVKSGLECGLKVDGYNDIKEGDVLEFYKQVEVARTL